ncbi:MAG: anthranilate synthase component I family protein, partial [Microbacterium sp.]
MREDAETVELPRSLAPDQAFAALRDEPHVFWLDAGAGAREGWSWVGAGSPDDPDAVVATPLMTAPAAPAAAGPFRTGWVGWIGYEPGAG